MKKIGIITGTRAEYGLLKTLIRLVKEDANYELVMIVTGMHLSPEFGYTCKEIENDGYSITYKNEMLLSSDTAVGINKSIGLGMIGFADTFANADLSLIILLGDRFEAFAAATAAMVHRIPIAHIHGGETTQGAIDEAFRHSITKMSAIHFTSAQEYRNRVIQLGENPKTVFNVGSLGIENIRKMKLMTRKELEEFIGLKLEGTVILVTFHPVTLENDTAERQFKNLLEVLEKQSAKIIFTKANADTNGRIINYMIDEYVSRHLDSAVSFVSMGQLRYLSALKYCSLVIGNSSSGIIEAPAFFIPTVNIGDRQKGRIRAASVIDCGSDTNEIQRAIQKALSEEFRNEYRNMKIPFERENSAELIMKYIGEYLNRDVNTKKIFYDLPGGN